MKWNTARHLAAAAAGTALAIAFATPSLAIDPNNPHQAAGATPVAAAQIPAAPANGEIGYVFSDFSVAIYPGMKENCPQGTAWTNREAYLSTVTPAERDRLLKPENEPELSKKWKASVIFPDGRNVCRNYDQFPERPAVFTVQNKTGYGINLDGDTGDGSKDPWICSHENFTGPSGEKGIDNQSYRVQGCTRQWRGPDGGFAEQVPGSRMDMARGEHTFVLLLRGVDSFVKDDHVEVILATADDMPITDGTQNYIKDASYTISNHPEWRHVLQGKIVNGVLTTEPADILLKRKYSEGQAKRPGSEYDWARAKLQLTIRPDGSLEGMIGGYEKPYANMVEKVGGGAGTVSVAGIDCAALWNTLLKYADGDRDPKTGQCRRISTAYNVIATPAFVFDRPPQSTKTAMAK